MASPLTRLAASLGAAWKALRMRWAGSSSWAWSAPYGQNGPYYPPGPPTDGRQNAIVAACLAWVGRVLPEAPLRVVRTNADGTTEVLRDHPLTRLLARPNPYYSGTLLLSATAQDFKASGNAYWIKRRNAQGAPLELWWVSSALIEPKWPEDGSEYVSHYEYSPGGTPIRLAAPGPDGKTGDVVHFRNGLDPRNPRKGLSELASLLREIATDEEAARFTASLLRNSAVPGAVIVPGPGVEVTPEKADAIKSTFLARFGGEHRGEPVVLGEDAKVSVLSFSPQQMDLRSLRAVPEERISAVMGIPAAVVGLGAGLAVTKVGATMSEMREEAYESCIIPMQRALSEEITSQLLPDFGSASRLAVEFDLSGVRVLQPDLDKLHSRLDTAVRGGWMLVNEARAEIGLDPLPDGDVLYVPVALTPTPPDALLPEEPPPEEPLALPAPAEDDEAEVETAAFRLPAGRKAVDGGRYAAGLTRLRERLEPGLARELAVYLEAQANRVARAVESQRKAITWREVFDALAEAQGLGKLLEPWFARVLEQVHADTAAALDLAFELDDPLTRQYLADAGRDVVGITETTRQAIASALQEGQLAGEGVGQLAARVREATAFDRPRATTIARTELGYAANRSAVASFRSSGVVVAVRILDGPDCGLHAHGEAPFADGMVVPLERMDEIPVMVHPNCTRALSPVLDAAELAGVA